MEGPGGLQVKVRTTSLVAIFCLSAVLVAPTTGHARAAQGFKIENKLSVAVSAEPSADAVPGVVAVTAQPLIRSIAQAPPGLPMSPDAAIERSQIGPGLPTKAPMQVAARLTASCNSDDMEVAIGGDFLARYLGWATQTSGSPSDGWQGIHDTRYYEPGAVVFPDQPDNPGGRLEVTDHAVTTRPVLPSSACGTNVQASTIADFHSVTLTSEGGDSSFGGGDILGETRMRILPGWAGSIFGWFDPPGRNLTVDDRWVTDPQSGDPQLRMRVVARAAGSWRESLATPYGPSWKWAFHGFNLFAADTAGSSTPAEAESALNVMPGQHIVALVPRGDEVFRRSYVAPGFGSAVLTDDGVEFRDIVELPDATGPSSPPAPRAPAPPVTADPGADPAEFDHCNFSIDEAEPAGNLCMSIGTDGGGAVSLSRFKMDDVAGALTGGLPFIEIDGVRHHLTADKMTEPPFVNEYQYGTYPGQAPSVVFSVATRFEVGGLRFSIYWIVVRDRILYGKLLFPGISGVRGPASRVVTNWYVRPTFADRANTVIEEGNTGMRIPVAATLPARGDLVTGSDSYWLRDAEGPDQAYYFPTSTGYSPSGLAWVSYDSRTTFANYEGAPSATPMTDALADPMLGGDVAIYKHDFFETFFMARAFADVFGPYGILFGNAPYGIQIL